MATKKARLPAGQVSSGPHALASATDAYCASLTTPEITLKACIMRKS